MKLVISVYFCLLHSRFLRRILTAMKQHQKTNFHLVLQQFHRSMHKNTIGITVLSNILQYVAILSVHWTFLMCFRMDSWLLFSIIVFSFVFRDARKAREGQRKPCQLQQYQHQQFSCLLRAGQFPLPEKYKFHSWTTRNLLCIFAHFKVGYS